MKLPHWVEEKIAMLPERFTGQIIIECHRGGVSRVETTQSHFPDRTQDAPVRHVLSAFSGNP